MTTSLVTVTTTDPLVTVTTTDPLLSVVVRQVEAGATGAPGVGIGERNMLASEALTAGDLVNFWSDAGTPKVRLACALAKGKEANGFVSVACAQGAVATVSLGGVNTAATGLTTGPLWLSVTPGKTQSAPASGAGRVVQRVGFAPSSTEIMFSPQLPITLST